MAPKKKGTRSSSSQQSPQQSQRQMRSISREASFEPQRQTRAGRKRRHSDASNASDQLSSTQSTSATPVKRRKRSKATAEAETEHERLQEVIEEEEEIEATTEGGAIVDGVEDIAVVHNKHVHFGGSDTKNVTVLTSNNLEGTGNHLATHPRKMTIKRRITASPTGDSVDESKRFRRTSIRHSLPPSLSQDGELQMSFIEERQFAPLKDVLRQRIRERRQKRERIQELNNELVDARLKKDASRAVELEEEIHELKEQQANLIASSNDDDVKLLDEDMLVLASQEEVQYPELPTASSEELLLRSSQNRSHEDVLSIERKRFEDAVLVLSEESNRAKHQLKILQIEVSGLGFASEDVDASVVLQTIRESFAFVRDTLKDVLLHAAPQNTSNEDLLSFLLTLIKDYASRLRVQDQELVSRSTLANDLGKQVQDLIDCLADSEEKRQETYKKFEALDLENDRKERRIDEVQEDFAEVANERDILQDELETKESEAQALGDENVELAQNIDRLTASLQSYREEESRLTDLISRMEEEHHRTVTKMNQEREETVRDLEGRLDDEYKFRARTEEQVVGQQASITALELKVEELETERDRLQGELVDMTALRDMERDAREAAETDLEERSHEVAQLEERVSLLDEDLDKLNTQLEDLRQSGEAEHTQRVAAESELDEKNAELEEFSNKLQAQGMQANELRQKLFEVQQQNESKVHELEQAASERDQQFQHEFAEEVARRESANDLAQERETIIEELKANLEQVEGEMRGLLAERDERIAELGQQLVQRAGEVEALHGDVQNTQALYDAHIEQANEQRQQQEASIASLQDTINEREEQMRSMRHEASALVEKHSLETEDRDAQILELDHNIAELRLLVADLRNEKAGLERRVEQEAEQMLELQNQKEDEIEALKATIHDKQAKIQTVEEKAIAADQRWQEFVNARDEDIATRDEEIALLRESDEEKTQLIATVRADAESVRRKFREYVVKTNGKMKGLRDENAAFKTRLERDGVELEEDGAQVLQEVDAMSVFQQTVVTTTTSRQSQEVVKRNTRGRKKRVTDSAIGLEESMLVE